MIVHRFLLECPEITTSRKLIPFFRYLFGLVDNAMNNGEDRTNLLFLVNESITLDSLNLEGSDDVDFYGELNNLGLWNIFFDKETLQGDIVLFDDAFHYDLYRFLARSGVLVSACYESGFVNKSVMCWTDLCGVILESNVVSSCLPPCRPIVQLEELEPRQMEFRYELQTVYSKRHTQYGESVILYGIAQYTASPRTFVKFVLEPQTDLSKVRIVLDLINDGVIPV